MVQVLFQKRVINMVTRITLVRREIDRAIDVVRQVGVYLDYAVVVPFVPIVTAPRLVRDIFNSETLIGRELQVGLGAGPALLDRELENRVELILGNKKALVPFGIALGESAMVGGVFWFQRASRFDLID